MVIASLGDRTFAACLANDNLKLKHNIYACNK